MEKGVFLELIVWEDFLDAVSKTRLQDEYNKGIRQCDIFVMLFWTKVGQYTEEEFETAFGQFKATSKPFIFTYFKDAEISTASLNKKDLMSLWAFQEKLSSLGHFYTVYKNIDELKFKFNQQLDKLAAKGFVEFDPSEGEAPTAPTISQANLTGSGAIAPGPGATAVGAGAVYVGGQNTGSINTGTQVETHTGGGAYIGGNVSAGRDFVSRDKSVYGDQIETGDVSKSRDLEPLFVTLLAAIAQHAPAEKQAAAVQQVQELKVEAAKGKQADDGKIAKIVDGLVELVPKAVGAIVSTFATPILGGVAGPVTKYVLDKLKGG